ncbi:CRISPR-associated protein Cas2 [Allocatelliglobosispora scoriae]|uniref:CRISPR-associated protein Cas2 n=1 Tax=Allocatelliglobosispora scoriae TaxID=643052 RepID=A0A841C5C9_9ACTN|nr:type I-E CRISPR-associated endoribonuclease Cas2e [Allocatelliglobosispora scoriae]MBB5874343.1 CRISPR-associated protein Cas2 [Allocatelliglobosispora scoriae]
MTVIVLTACPAGLRGNLTQWLLELSAGVYVGHISARVRQRLWSRVVEMAGPGRALMVFQVRGEQRLSFLVHDHHWVPVDVDGVVLMRRPVESVLRNAALPEGWSKAAKRRKFGRRNRGGGSGDASYSDEN